MSESMTSQQRLLRAIQHQEVDRVPCCPRMFNWMSGNYGMDYWVPQMRLANEFGLDPLVHVYGHAFETDQEQYPPQVSMEVSTTRHADHTEVRRIFHTPAGDLREVKIAGDPGPVYGDCPDPLYREHLLKEPEDLERLKFLLPEFSRLRAAILPTIIDLVGDRGLVVAQPRQGAGGHAFLTYLGSERAMLLAYDNPDFLRQALRLFNDFFQEAARVCLEQGAPVVMDCWWAVSVGSGWSPAHFREFALPLIEENIQLVHSYGALYHYYDDGAMDTTVDWIAEAGADLVETLAPPPLGDVDLAEVKQRIGHLTCLKGNVDQVNLIWRGTPEQVREAVRAAIEAAAPGSGFILSTADSIRPESPRENVDAYFEAWREFGRY